MKKNDKIKLKWIELSSLQKWITENKMENRKQPKRRIRSTLSTPPKT